MSDLSTKVKKAIEYIKQIDAFSMPLGRYEIPGDEGSYFFVQEYTTKGEEACKVESHTEHIDVQWIINGNEKIKVCAVDKLQEKIPYNPDKDVTIWEPIDNMAEVALSSGAYVVLYPSDAHQPGIAVWEPELIKKLVIKVKI